MVALGDHGVGYTNYANGCIVVCGIVVGQGEYSTTQPSLFSNLEESLSNCFTGV